MFKIYSTDSQQVGGERTEEGRTSNNPGRSQTGKIQMTIIEPTNKLKSKNRLLL